MFYEFSQNNSGDWFEVDDNLNQYVIIEANSAEEANDIAESIGIYFHGAGDCECCGARWSSVWHDDKGTETPQIYGEEVAGYEGWRSTAIIVHYLDGRKETY